MVFSNSNSSFHPVRFSAPPGIFLPAPKLAILPPGIDLPPGLDTSEELPRKSDVFARAETKVANDEIPSGGNTANVESGRHMQLNSHARVQIMSWNEVGNREEYMARLCETGAEQTEQTVDVVELDPADKGAKSTFGPPPGLEKLLAPSGLEDMSSETELRSWLVVAAALTKQRKVTPWVAGPPEVWNLEAWNRWAMPIPVESEDKTHAVSAFSPAETGHKTRRDVDTSVAAVAPRGGKHLDTRAWNGVARGKHQGSSGTERSCMRKNLARLGGA